VSISKTPKRRTTLECKDVMEYIERWCESNTFEEDSGQTSWGSGQEDAYGHRLARLGHAAVIGLGFQPLKFSEQSKIDILEAVVTGLDNCDQVDFVDRDYLIEAAWHYWDSIYAPLGCDATLTIAAQAVEKTTMPPGAYLDSQASVCRFLWHMLQLLPDDENYGEGVKYLSCRKAAEAACRFDVIASEDLMRISRAFDALRRNGVIEVVSVGSFQGKKSEASRFRVLQKEQS